MLHSKILILDYGSQYTQLIARRLREFGFYSFILPGDSELSRIEKFEPHAVILSGGPSSVYEEGAPQLAQGFWDWQKRKSMPILGVCYGMQLMVQHFGGKIGRAEKREYGRMGVVVKNSAGLFKTLNQFNAWMSHGDETLALPSNFECTAKSESGAVAAMENTSAKLSAIQFHPEVTHTENGDVILKNFLVSLAGLKPDWSMGNFIEEELKRLSSHIHSDAHVICALSGGVDSTVAATLVHQAIGNRLHCVFVDTGMLRYKERERVMKLFTDQLHLPVTCVDAEERFLSKLAGVTDPEQKRKIIGAEFIAVFDEAATLIEKQIGKRPEYLVQGTLYPDVIESSPAPSDATTSGTAAGSKKHSATIKSHHNVGGLPKDLKFKLVEPLRELFKDEVRALGAQLKVPTDFLKRHPFPGPGLAVRTIGEIKREYLDILRHADEIFIEMLKTHGLYSQIWQAMAIFLPIRTVGVQGDGRTHDHVIALRAVTSSDGMTADWFPFDAKFLAQVSSRICNEVRGVNRVVYDISSKPPATIEWE